MKSLIKVLLTLILLFGAVTQIPKVHRECRQMFLKRAQKGFSSLEQFNDTLWSKPKRGK